jgi:hypothetical protein
MLGDCYLGYYFGIGTVWIRVKLLFYYWFCWIWNRISTYHFVGSDSKKLLQLSEKLEMTDEPVNISNIEKKS